MGNFANNQREQQKREERESTAREVLGKTFHDLGKTSFAVMMVGNMSPLFGLSEMSVWQTLSLITLGVGLSAWLIYLGNKIIKKK